jgi:asparagine synthase (glutamine-hydrolysing)
MLSRLTRQQVTVALSGDGGDELFAGYERFAAALALKSYTKIPAPVRRGTRSLLGALPQSAARGRVGSLNRFATRADMDMPDAFRSWLAYVTEEDRHSLMNDPSDWALDDYRRVWRETEGADALDRLLALNMKTYLVDDLLQKADRMSMAHGLEVRSPFLDHHLIDFALRLL